MAHKDGSDVDDLEVEEASDASASDASEASDASDKKKKSKKHKKDKKEKKSKKKHHDRNDKKEKKSKKSKKGKKEKKSKGKRGPRGKQWNKWKIPFQPNSGAAQLFQKLMEKGGMKEKDYEKACKKLGVKAAWALGRFTKEQRRGWTWTFDDSNGRYRVTNVKLHKSKDKK